ncbi:MAG: metallophosphoesterase [Planctomycetota bacterium]|nr:MAG: metallophosphoesterase [Planctomycetota bacterium]
MKDHIWLTSTANVARRTVLRGIVLTVLISGAVIAFPWSPAIGQTHRPEKQTGLLKGYVVADAHFGWRHPQQPEPQEIEEAMQRIVKRFPDLDLFLDAGDAHHVHASDEARGQCTDIIPGGCWPIPFYFIAGNHEIDVWGGPYDTEWRCAKFGNLTCRPYYSFDLKGVHFIALPELIFMCYVSQEALAWLELDLAVNKDKTVVIFTHNAIRGTTSFCDDAGYRSLANSEAVLKLLNRYPNVLAWMHGHNHTYEMVRKAGKLFVSNGRIGGFVPPETQKWAGDHLGGIYFEIGPGHLTARAYSATEDNYLDALGYPQLMQKLNIKTSFDSGAAPCFSYGGGGTIDGQRLAALHHCAGGNGPRELFIAGADSPIINENPDLTVYTERSHPLAPDKKILPGYKFRPHDDSLWEWIDPGIRIGARTESDESTTLVAPGPHRGVQSYYSCPPGKTYRVIIEVVSSGGGQTLQLKCRIHDRRIQQVASLGGPVWKLVSGRQTLQTDFSLPPLSDLNSIYTNPKSDNLFRVLIEARFSNLREDVLVKRFAIMLADAAGPTIDVAVSVEGKKFMHKGELASDKFVRFDLPSRPPARSVYEISAGGNHRLTWLVRQTDLAWQVRNASVATKDSYLDIGPLRNTLSSRKEIVIVPMSPIEVPYVHRLRHINRAGIYPLSADKNQLKVEAVELLGPAQIEICTNRKPKQVANAEGWTFSKDRLILSLKKPGTVVIQF